MDQLQLEKQLKEVLSQGMKDLEDNVQKNLDELLDARVKKYMEENKVDVKNIVPVNPVNKGDGEDGEQKYSKIGGFIKSVFKKDAKELAEYMSKGMTEGTDSAGGFLVPEGFHNEVMRIALDYGLVFKLSTRFTMSTDTLNVPTGATSVTVSWPGETNPGTASTPGFGNAQLNAKTCVGLTVTSNELLADSGVDTTKYLMELFGEALAGEFDNQAFNGTGSPFVGIFSDANVNLVNMNSGQTTFASVTLANLRDLISAVPTNCLPTSAFFMHRQTWGVVQKIQEGSQTIAAIQVQPINTAITPGQIKGTEPVGYIWGYPVYLSDKIVSSTAVSTKFIAFGSMKKGLFWGDRQQMTISISQDATVASTSLFETNQSAVRVTQRGAVKVGLATSFSVLKTAAS